jgi:glycosyltransferase involved in cell wall biosynthesis
MKISVIIPYVQDRGYLAAAHKSANEAIEYANVQGEVILSQSDHGVSYNLNRGIDRAKGELITYLCDDDLLPLSSIRSTVDGMRGHDFIHGNASTIYEENFAFVEPHIRRWKPVIKRPKLLQMIDSNHIHGGTVTYQHDIVMGEWFDEDLWCAEEYDFNMFLLDSGKTIGYINADLYTYRHHATQKSKQMNNQRERRAAIEEIRDRYR